MKSSVAWATAWMLVLVWTASAAESACQTFYPNGLELTVLPDSDRTMAAVMAIVGAGLRTEGFGTNGVSHFLEHLLFNGTESLSQEQLYEELDLIGGYCNAATREECTLYFLLVPPENATRAVWLLDQMLYHSVLPGEKIEKERGVILSEIRQDRSSDGLRAGEALRSLLYRGTPYAMSILGSETGVATLSRDDLVSYYKALYAANNTKLILMGNLDVARAMSAVDSTFAREPSTELLPAQAFAVAPLRGRVCLAAPIEHPRAYVVAETPVPGHEAYPTAEVMEQVLRLRAEAAGHGSLEVEWETSGNSGRLIISASGDNGSQPEELLGYVAALVHGMSTSPPSSSEVHAAKARLRAEELFLQEKLHFFLISRPNELWTCGPGYALDRVRRLDAVTTDAVRSLAVTVCDSVALGEVVVVPAVSQSPGPDTVALDTTVAGTLTRIRREPDSPLFALHVLFRDRSLREQGEWAGGVELLHRLVAAGPDTSNIGLRWASLGAQITFFDNPYFSHDDLYQSPRYSYIRFELPAESWRQGVALLGQCLRAPRITEASLAAARQDLARAQAHQARDARYVGRNRFLAELLPGHPVGRGILGSEETVGAVTAEEMQGFHRSYMAPGNTIVTVVGPAPPYEVASALAHLLPEGTPEDPDRWPPLPETLADITHWDSLGSGRAHVVWGYVIGPVPNEWRPGLQLAVSSLSTALVQEVREECGLAYGVGASLVWLKDQAWLQVEVGTRPEVVGEVVSAIRATVEEQRGREFSRRDVRREVERRRGRLLLRSLSRVGQAYYMGVELLEGRCPLDAEEHASPTQVASAARRYLRQSPAVTVIVR